MAIAVDASDPCGTERGHLQLASDWPGRALDPDNGVRRSRAGDEPMQAGHVRKQLVLADAGVLRPRWAWRRRARAAMAALVRGIADGPG